MDRLEAATVLHERGDDEGAARLLEQARAEDPKAFEPLWRQAYHRVVLANRIPDRKARAARVQSLLPQIDTLLRGHGDQADTWFVAALASGIQSTTVAPRRRVELSKQVRERIERCLGRDPAHPGAWFLLGRWHEGFATLNPVERTFVDLLLGGMPEGASLDSARLALERADRLRPDDLQILSDLVRVLALQGRTDKARLLAKRSLNVPPRHDADRRVLESLRVVARGPTGGGT
jgi:tetratricopeptide (TPR) repeat protein